MDKNYWHQKWLNQDIGFNQSQPNKLMQRYFPSIKLEPGSRVFVPLCGQSIDMLWLASQGYNVVGVEISHVACSAFFNNNGIIANITEIDDFILYKSDSITLFSGDFFKLTPSTLGRVDAVYDRAALVALPEDNRQSYANHLIELMNSTTLMFLITTSYNQNEMQGPPFSVNDSEVNAIYGAHFDITQLYNKQFEIPAHLQSKGLRRAAEQAYLLSRKGL